MSARFGAQCTCVKVKQALLASMLIFFHVSCGWLILQRLLLLSVRFPSLILITVQLRLYLNISRTSLFFSKSQYQVCGRWQQALKAGIWLETQKRCWQKCESKCKFASYVKYIQSLQLGCIYKSGININRHEPVQTNPNFTSECHYLSAHQLP